MRLVAQPVTDSNDSFDVPHGVGQAAPHLVVLRAERDPRPARRYAWVQATAELYQVDDKTVRRWISSGLITGYRVGSMLVRVDLDEVEAKVVEVIPATAQAKQ